MSSVAKKNGEASEVMVAIAELKLELSKQIRDNFSSLEARVIALEDCPSNLDERIRKLEDQPGFAGILGSFQPQLGTTVSMRETPPTEAKEEPWNVSAPKTIPPAHLQIGSFPRAPTFPNFGTTQLGKSMPPGTTSLPFMPKQIPLRMALLHRFQ